MKEIEYKYLVNKELWAKLEKSEPELIVQGFLSKTKDLVIRIRIKGKKGYLTIKGKTIGVTRTEFEYEIPLSDAKEIISQFTDKHIRKYRYEIVVGSHTWEIDEFQENLKGLILAEVELKSEEEIYEIPNWVTEDVSLDSNYYNSVLIDKC